MAFGVWGLGVGFGGLGFRVWGYLGGDGLGEHGLAGAGRPKQKHPLPGLADPDVDVGHQ